MVKLRISSLLMLLFSSLLAVNAQALTVKAVTGQDQVGLGESLELQLRLDESPDNAPDLAPLQQGWEILGQSESSQRQYVNGKFSSSFTYRYSLMPRQAGDQLIPAVCFGQDCSKPIKIKVTKGSALDNSIESQVQLEASISSTRAMPQSQVILRVRLALLAGLPEGQLTDPEPVGVKALVKKLSDVRKYERRDSGQTIQVFEREYAIFPQESGQMEIPALQYDGLVAGGRTRFDPFGRQGMRVRRTTKPMTVEVAPLPSDLGRRPWLPSTGVVLEDDWQQKPPQLVVGEPATRTLTLSAKAVLAAQLPELKSGAPADFKVYPDQPVREDHRIRSGVKGSLVQKVALVPTRAGSIKLPAIDLDWWDLNANRWRTAHLDALVVEVAPAPQVAAPPAAPVVPETKNLPQPEERPVASPVPQPQAGTSEGPAVNRQNFWPGISLALALGWGLTLILLWNARRGSSRPQGGEDDHSTESGKVDRRAVIDIARRKDPQAVRHALVAWSRELFPNEEGRSYDRLRSECPVGLAEELCSLDAHLYGETSFEWSEVGLIAALKDWNPNSTNRSNAVLPDLYP